MNEQNINETIDKWRERLEISQKGHYYQHSCFSILNVIFGTILIVSSTTSLFLLSEEFSRELMKIFSWTEHSITIFKMLLGICASISSYLQVFIRFSEKAELHKVYASRYGILKRDIELLYCEADLAAKLNGLKSIKESWKGIAQDAPTTSKCIRNLVHLCRFFEKCWCNRQICC